MIGADPDVGEQSDAPKRRSRADLKWRDFRRRSVILDVRHTSNSNASR